MTIEVQASSDGFIVVVNDGHESVTVYETSKFRFGDYTDPERQRLGGVRQRLGGVYQRKANEFATKLGRMTHQNVARYGESFLRLDDSYAPEDVWAGVTAVMEMVCQDYDLAMREHVDDTVADRVNVAVGDEKAAVLRVSAGGPDDCENLYTETFEEAARSSWRSR